MKTISASRIYAMQNKAMHKAMTLLGIPYNDDKPTWVLLFRNTSGRSNIGGMSDMTLSERRAVIQQLKRRGAKVTNPVIPEKLAEWQRGDADMESGYQYRTRYPGRPKNIERGSRADQLKKIEALLTVGKRPWTYADAIAKRVCKVDKVPWVPDDELYKVITALRIQAKREGWDLSGEK